MVESGQSAQADAFGEDGDLLAASTAGDQQAFSRLLSRHYRPVYRVAWRMLNGNAEAEDVAQEAFLKLWQNPAQLREAKALRGWLMRVASNLALDRLRRRPHEELEAAEKIEDKGGATGRDLDRRTARLRVDRAIAKLPDRQKLALTLVFFEGFGNIEAAKAMDTTVEAVESLLGRAKRNLKEELASDWRYLLGEMADTADR
jgi:RNA polymerase sigma-70 factor (ECF subfamily)